MTGPRCRRRLSATLLATCAFWAGLAAEAVAQGSAASDRAVLEALYDVTGGRDWIDNTNWKTSAPLGEWFGVTTDTAGRVTRLELPGNGLAGPIPAALGELALLRNLELGSRWDSEAQQSVENTLTGSIPAELRNLTNLDWLDLSGNALTGPVPSWLGRLTSLWVLDVSGNELTGSIPAELENLANLGYLYLGRNALTGPVPLWLGRLTSVRSLSLSGNALTGPIPAELGNLANLDWLSLSGNALTGPIPAELASLENLRSLYLHYNGLSGPIPSELGDLANLERLDLENNGLDGAIPSELGDLANLQSLDLSTNPLTGPLPQGLTELASLTLLDVRYTGVCAPHDEVFQAWLATIDFQGESCNRPPEAVDAIPAQTLTESGPALALPLEPYFTDPDDDALTYAATSSRGGTVTALVSDDTLWLAPGAPGTATVTVTARDPDGLSADQSVAVTTTASAGSQNDREVLEVFYDATSGPSWTNRTNWKTSAPLGEWHGVTTDDDGRVTHLSLSNNGLTGPLSRALANLGNLEYLNLSRNDLVGPLPAWLGNFAGLRWLSLWGNRFTGPIPDSLASLVKLEGLELERNDLTGPVPAWLGNLPNLQSLWLSGNQLTGPIPSVLRRLANLRTLVLAWNDLTGPVPSWFGDLTELRYLDLAGTALTGPIPDEWGNLENLERLGLDYAWGISGPLPAGLRQSNLERVDLFATRACTPATWHEWLETIEFEGRACEAAPSVAIDVAVVYTPAAREEAGGTAEIEAVIDLMIAETNEAYEAGGVQHRLALAARSEVQYTEAGDGRDLGRLADSSGGYMDEVHALRDRTGADLVHLVFKHQGHPFGGIAYLPGAFGLTCQWCGGGTFAHELGHNMGLSHARYETGGGRMSHPAYGYVNQHGLAGGVAPSTRWRTIMAYADQCTDAYTSCRSVLRFSNPHQSHNSDPLGIAFRDGGSGVTGPADAVAVLNATGPIVADWRDHVPRSNRPPRAAGTLPDRTMTRNAEGGVDVSSAFVAPAGA
ncbi:MAG: M12 family metallo-peptidase, partial [Acidobacteria bacterium]|nr:M12 family metallo-peptidase [Acidobacteriota bacterium]